MWSALKLLIKIYSFSIQKAKYFHKNSILTVSSYEIIMGHLTLVAGEDVWKQIIAVLDWQVNVNLTLVQYLNTTAFIPLKCLLFFFSFMVWILSFPLSHFKWFNFNVCWFLRFTNSDSQIFKSLKTNFKLLKFSQSNIHISYSYQVMFCQSHDPSLKYQD